MLKLKLKIQKEKNLSDTDFCPFDVRFHRSISDASHNPVLQFIMFSVSEAFQPIENMVVFQVRDREVIISQHEKLLESHSGQGMNLKLQ